MTVVKPKEAPYPGLADDAIEHQTDTVQIGEGNTTGTVTFNTEAGFENAPTVGTSAELSASSGGSASSTVDRVELTTRTASQVVVEVELDAAPGAGETADVTIGATMMGA